MSRLNVQPLLERNVSQSTTAPAHPLRPTREGRFYFLIAATILVAAGLAIYVILPRSDVTWYSLLLVALGYLSSWVGILFGKRPLRLWNP